MSNRYFALTLLALTLSSQPSCDCDVGQGKGLACNISESISSDSISEIKCNATDDGPRCVLQPTFNTVNFKILGVDLMGFLSVTQLSYVCNVKFECNEMSSEVCKKLPCDLLQYKLLSEMGKSDLVKCVDGNVETISDLKSVGRGVQNSLSFKINGVRKDSAVLNVIYPNWCTVSSVTLYPKDTSMTPVRFVP